MRGPSWIGKRAEEFPMGNWHDLRSLPIATPERSWNEALKLVLSGHDVVLVQPGRLRLFMVPWFDLAEVFLVDGKPKTSTNRQWDWHAFENILRGSFDLGFRTFEWGLRLRDGWTSVARPLGAPPRPLTMEQVPPCMCLAQFSGLSLEERLLWAMRSAQ